ncbi:acyltransferase [Legionella qingyii]|uniref:Acyltransferase n=1 Tax=Legionella qingyii TaxID=2184757 RepID=A0A317TX62_9GAMM|nr:acyltransferase [Legionella qingyii]PWY54033.1 acyltransferase [Legionella qingyii]RUR19872.1 acyltransferase [Legionella qingyii]RUR22344.1 acyltransferase [Legionella qingyii]
MSDILCTNSRIEFANTLRGLAALSVVISHYLSSFWYKRDSIAHLINAPLFSPESHAIPPYIIWLNLFPLFDWGAYGVGLFFIISGFVIPFSLHRINAIGFCINRLFRIIPTYMIGFSITLLALFLCGKYFPAAWPYTFQEVLIHYIPGIRDILGSRNIDIIIWTLEIEMKFYLIVALSIAWFRSYSLNVFFIPTTLFLLTCYASHMIPVWAMNHLVAFIQAEIYMMSTPYLIFMFIGVVFHYLFCQKISSDMGYLIISILFFMFCIAWWAGPYSNNLILAWSYALALLTFMFAYIFPHLFKANLIFNFLAGISYPLYITHSIMGYIILRIMLDMNFRIGIALSAVIFASVLLSWFLHVFVERPSQSLGKKLAEKLSFSTPELLALITKSIKSLRLQLSKN